MHIPGLREELMRPRSYRADRFKFRNLVSYFQGSGTKVMSKSCSFVIGDEVDQFMPPPNVNQINEMDKRRRSYDHSILGLVCTPTVENGSIWKEYLKGSQAQWYLKCKGCGKHTLNSNKIINLQFESTYNEELRTYIVKEGSERLICPICGYQHVESDKEWMNEHGCYKHKIPELIDTRPSFQFGALASCLKSLSWTVIAQQQLDAGKSSDINLQMSFDNSIRGLPYKPRKISKDEILKLRENHCWKMSPTLENTEMIFATIDTMDDFYSYAVWAWDTNDNMNMLECGEVTYLTLQEDKKEAINEERKKEGLPSVITFEDIMEKEYMKVNNTGLKMTFVMIDQGGHKGNDVKYFSKIHKNVIMQKGTSMKAENWKCSENQERLIITNEKFWRSTTIYYLYAQRNREENYLYFYPEISEEHLSQISSVVPDNTSKWGDEYSNWVSKNGNDHIFDCIKYAYLARDFALNSFSSKRYRFLKAPSLLKRFERQIRNENARKQDSVSKSTWFDV